MTYSYKPLTDWYKQNKRNLPWRKSKSPYIIWLSEIILQQTRVKQGINYFQRFMERFPTIYDLADAEEEEVLKLWQGLGYYTRARNLHRTAQIVVKNYSGHFPSEYKLIKELPGIGDYTAAAIGSIAFNIIKPAIDGNFYRVLSRLFGISTPIDTGRGKREFLQVAMEMIDPNDPGTFNQAVMELGATVCTPQSPHCNTCPLSHRCHAYSTNTYKDFPRKKNIVKQTERFFNYLLIEKDNQTWLQKRTDNDIWRNLHQLPLIETPKLENPETVLSSTGWNTIFKDVSLEIESISNIIVHILSHQKIHARFYRVKLLDGSPVLPFHPINQKDIFNFAVPKLIENYLNKVYSETGVHE